MYYLLRGKKGLREMRETIVDLTNTIEGKWFFIAGVISAVLLTLMLLTGLITFGDILEMERRMIEFCPYCI